MTTIVTIPWIGSEQTTEAIEWCMEHKTAHVYAVCVEEVANNDGIIVGVRCDMSLGTGVGVMKNYAQHILACVEHSPGAHVSFIFESDDDATLFALSFTSVDPALDENLSVAFDATLLDYSDEW